MEKRLTAALSFAELRRSGGKLEHSAAARRRVQIDVLAHIEV